MKMLLESKFKNFHLKFVFGMRKMAKNFLKDVFFDFMVSL